MLVSRDEFRRLERVDATTLTDIHRAARFYYTTRMRFSSNLNSSTFGISTTSGPNINLLRLEEELSAAHLRLARVFVENLPFIRLIDRYDRQHTVFYIDPPYFGCENDYGKEIFQRTDFEVLAERLATIKGKFIMSINDVPEIRKLFASFNLQTVKTGYSMGDAKKNGVVRELLVCNF